MAVPLRGALLHCVRPWQKRAFHLPIGHRLNTASLAKRFSLAYRTSYIYTSSLAKCFPLAYWTSYGVLGKALFTCLLDIVYIRRPWQSASHLPTGHSMASLAKRCPLHRMASLAKRFQFAFWTSYDVLGKAIPTCLLDIARCPWQSASHLPFGHRMTSLAK